MSPSYHIYSTTEEAWDAMYQAIEEAVRSIYWEVYIFRDDDVGHRFFDLLMKKASAGVTVKLIIDAVGSFAVRDNRIDALRAAGVDVRVFSERKHRYANWWRRIYVRTHRKILIIDERVGFIGGVNIDKRMRGWRDIHLKVTGPIIFDLLHSFARSYVVSGGRRGDVRLLLRRYTRAARTKARVSDMELVADVPDKRMSRVRRRYAMAIRQAKHRVILFTPYYFPDRHFLRAIWQARRRGVKIDLLLPLRTDVRLATYAAYAWLHLLNRYGVKIHILRDMMHGKGMIIDDDAALVGSGNLDQTSFYDNYEANVHIRDRETVGSLTAILERWIGEAESYDPVTWEKRSVIDKIKEKIAYYLLSIWHRR